MATSANAVELESTVATEQHVGAPQGAAPTVIRVAEVEQEHPAHPETVSKPTQTHSQQAVRIQARVPPAEAVTVPVSRGVSPVVPALVENAPTHAVIPVYTSSAQQQREQQFRVRTALTKGWRKGKKSRKSVGGGRGPGFTAREVEGLLEVLEEAIPVTREEWEQVRLRHAGRFPGTSRSIDSIRRKFAKVYLARGPNGENVAEVNLTPTVRRAKVIRERMASRAVSLEDEESVLDPNSAVAVVEAMDTTEMQEEEELQNGAHAHTHAHAHPHAQVENGVAVAGNAEAALPHPDSGVPQAQAVALEPQQVLDDTNMSVMQPMVSEPMAVGASVNVVQAVATGGMEIESASPGHVRKPMPEKDVSELEELVNTMKIYIDQDRQWREEERHRLEQEREEQRQWREEERRQRAEDRAMYEAREEASRKREATLNERITQLLGMLSPAAKTPCS